MKPFHESSDLFFSDVSALAGVLFSFETVVISGAEQTIQKTGNGLMNPRQGEAGIFLSALEILVSRDFRS